MGRMFMIISAFISATGQLCWKLGHENIMLMLLGCALYGVGAIFMMLALSKGKMSEVYPLMCVGYIISLFYGQVFLGEPITVKKIIAIAILSIGVVMMNVDFKKEVKADV